MGRMIRLTGLAIIVGVLLLCYIGTNDGAKNFKKLRAKGGGRGEEQSHQQQRKKKSNNNIHNDKENDKNSNSVRKEEEEGNDHIGCPEKGGPGTSSAGDEGTQIAIP